jgi:hypothetical protein
MNFSQFVFRPKLITTAAAILFCIPSLAGQNSSFISFTVAGVGDGDGGTYPAGINLSGTIAGYYEGADKASEGGFIRDPNGAITEFSPTDLNDFRFVAINESGQISGYGAENSTPYEFVGVLRDANGEFMEFAVLADTATFVNAMNNNGVVAGMYQDSAQGNHGFLRNADGSFTLVDDPDALLAPWEGTVAVAINDNGTLVGNYTDKNTGTQRGFIRDQFGKFTNFNAATVRSASTYPVAINLSGQVAGYYCLDHCPINGNPILTGFLRSAAGHVTDVVYPGAVSTQVTGINDGGVLVGFWRDSVGYEHGFRREPSGKLAEIAPSGPFLAVVPGSINNHGTITGYYANDDFGLSGFVIRGTSR